MCGLNHMRLKSLILTKIDWTTIELIELIELTLTNIDWTTIKLIELI